MKSGNEFAVACSVALAVPPIGFLVFRFIQESWKTLGYVHVTFTGLPVASALSTFSQLNRQFWGRECFGSAERDFDPDGYTDGQVHYDRLAHMEFCQAELQRVRSGARDHRITLTCAEKEPLDGYRTILMGRRLERACAIQAAAIAYQAQKLSRQAGGDQIPLR